MKRKNFIILLIFLSIISISFITFSILFKNKNIEIIHYENSPCYYYISNDSVKLFKEDNHTISFYKNTKNNFIFIDEDTNTTFLECITKKVTKREFCEETSFCKINRKSIELNAEKCQEYLEEDETSCLKYKINNYTISFLRHIF